MTDIDVRPTDEAEESKPRHERPAIALSPGITYQELLDTDTHPVPPILREQSPADFEDQMFIPKTRFTSRKYHELEKERVWKKVWQFACREEHIPEPGDTYVYDICDISILIVRGKDMGIRAFYNTCLHRGRQLRHEGGPTDGEIRCSYHGFCWNLDGSIKRVTAAWDFPHLRGVDMDLPQIMVDVWAGFVFVNMDTECEPLADFMGDLDRHFTAWPLDRRYIQAHIEKELDCNWKLAQEAFSEAFHVITTHPQRVSSIGDSNSQYDCWGNFDRGIAPNGIPSPHITWVPTEQQMFDGIVDARMDEPPLLVVPEGMTAREVSGMAARESLRTIIGDEAADNLSDAESMDSIWYSLFPNFHPWGAYQRIVYRFRPLGDDHEKSLMEVFLLAPFVGERPAPAKPQRLGLDATWFEAEVLGSSARVFDQDSYNLPKVQKGLKSMQKSHVVMARYQESKIRHQHHLLNKWIGEDVEE